MFSTVVLVTVAIAVPVFAVTGNLYAYQQVFKNVLVAGDPDPMPILQAKVVTLSTKSLINLAQGLPTTSIVPTGVALGLTCELSPRLVVVQKATTTTPASVIKEIGTATVDDGSVVIHDAIVTIDGIKGPMSAYAYALATFAVSAQDPGFTDGTLGLAIKETYFTNPATDPLEAYGCPKATAITNAVGTLSVAMDGTDEEVYLQIYKGTLKAARTLLGYVPEAP